MRIIILLFVALILVSNVQALGITPASMDHDYIEGRVATGKFKVIANTNTMIDISGELSDYIELNKYILPKGEHIIDYTIRMPSDMSPGLNTAYVTALEITNSKSTVSAATKVTATINLIKPFGEEYATITIYTPKDNSNSFIYKVENKGIATIENANLILNIREANRNIMTLETKIERLESGESKTGSLPITNELEDGKYNYAATLNYGNNIANTKSEFTYGSPKIIYMGVRAPQFILGGINEFIITLDNPYNTPIFYKFTFDLSQSGSLLDRYEKTDTLEGRTEEEVSAFINTHDATIGEARVITTLDYEGKRSIYEESIEITHSSASVVGRVITQPGGSNTLIFLIIIAIIINSIFIVIIYKAVKKK